MAMSTALLRRTLETGTGPMPDLPGGTFSPLKQRVPVAKQPTSSTGLNIVSHLDGPPRHAPPMKSYLEMAEERLAGITDMRRSIVTQLSSLKEQFGVQGIPPGVLEMKLGTSYGTGRFAPYDIMGGGDDSPVKRRLETEKQIKRAKRAYAIESAQLQDVQAYMAMEGPEDWPQVLTRARLEEQDEQAFTQKALELWESRHVTPADKRREEFALPGTDKDVTPSQAAGDARRRALIASMSKRGFDDTKKLGSQTILGG